MKRCFHLLYIAVACLALGGCSGSASYTLGTADPESFTLGDDSASRATAVVLKVMEITDKYDPRLRQLQHVPDLSEMRLAHEDMRMENDLFNAFIAGLASALYNSRPITGSGYTFSFDDNDIETVFSITTTEGVTYDGRIDEDSSACYVQRKDADGIQLCKFIADLNGYYIELISQDGEGEWLLHRAYYSGNKWLCARARLDEQPSPDYVYHYLPYDFEYFIDGMPPLIMRAEYRRKEQLTYWNFDRDREYEWQLEE